MFDVSIFYQDILLRFYCSSVTLFLRHCAHFCPIAIYIVALFFLYFYGGSG